MRHLNRLRLKQDIERKETGKSLYDFAMVILILMSLHWLSLRTSLRGYVLLTLINKLLTNSETDLLNIWCPYMELKYASKLGSGNILKVLHSVLVSVR